MRRTLITLAMLAAATPVFAQARQQAADNDPTRKVAGGGAPAGWTIRLDDKDQARYTTADTKLFEIGGGYHVTSGPAALYYTAAHAQKNGPFSIKATLTQTKAPSHPEAVGLFAAGRDLESADKQTYVYFLVRGTGEFFVAHRAGAERHVISPWTANPAVNKANAAGQATNELSIAAGADSVRFLVNGKQVFTVARSELTDVSGMAGLRVNHNLDIHIADLQVKSGK